MPCLAFHTLPWMGIQRGLTVGLTLQPRLRWGRRVM